MVSILKQLLVDNEPTFTRNEHLFMEIMKLISVVGENAHNFTYNNCMSYMALLRSIQKNQLVDKIYGSQVEQQVRNIKFQLKFKLLSEF